MVVRASRVAGGQGGQQGGQQGQGAHGLFDQCQSRERSTREFGERSGRRSVITWHSSPRTTTFSSVRDHFRSEFRTSVDTQPDAGIQVGMAILSDIEAFFFIQAAQGDRRVQHHVCSESDTVQRSDWQRSLTRPRVIWSLARFRLSVLGAVGFQPDHPAIPDGINLTVVAVISADRRYVRLSLAPHFQQLIEVQTFTQVNCVAEPAIGGGGWWRAGRWWLRWRRSVAAAVAAAVSLASAASAAASAVAVRVAVVGGGGGQGGGQQGQQGQAGWWFSPGTVQLPVISTISVSTTVSVPDGGTVLLGGVKRLQGRPQHGWRADSEQDPLHQPTVQEQRGWP